MPKGRFMRLLVLLLGLLVLSPLFEEYFKLRLLGDLFFTAIFIYASYSLSRSKALATSAVVWPCRRWYCYGSNPSITQRGWRFPGGRGVAFMVIISAAFLHHIFLEQDINADLIAGAIVVYLIMALM